MIKNLEDRSFLGAYCMSGAVAEKQAVNGIESIASVLDCCYGQSLDSDKADDIEFFAYLASETGTPVNELKDFARLKVREFTERLIASLKDLQNNPCEDIIIESVTDVYQTSCSFYDNYGYLIQPECLEQFLGFIDTLGSILDDLSFEFDSKVKLTTVPTSEKQSYNLEKMISVVCD